MRVGWVVSTTGCFGAVRECVEVSNALVRLGHDVTVYSEGGEKITWLPYLGQVGAFADAATAHDDVCIMMSDWKRKHYDAFLAASPKLRCVCVMGFDPSETLADMLRGRDASALHDPAVMREALHLPGVLVLADSSWQVEWLTREVGVTCGPPIGGVSLAQFHPVAGRRAKEPYRLLATGDPRPRKGSEIVVAAVKRLQARKMNVELVTYWGKRLAQDKMAEWYSNGDVFLDAERRAGWCNPVAEAMACGTACVTTDIGAVRDFAVDGKTALLVPVDDAEKMALAVIHLLANEPWRKALAAGGLRKMQEFDYNVVGQRLADWLEARLA
jgi:glycosyltransferase involved in cell wall biosynthesis